MWKAVDVTREGCFVVSAGVVNTRVKTETRSVFGCDQRVS